MKTLPLLVTITTVLYIILLSVDVTQANGKRKYAPAYCLKFRLNCASQQKKKHVCCIYPLPNTKGGVTPSQPDTEGIASTGVSATVSGVGVRPSFRPIRLPAKTAPTSSTSTQAPKANDDNVEKVADGEVKKNSESATGLISKRPSIRFKTKSKTPEKKKSKKPTKDEQKKGSLVGGSKASLLQRQKRPRICLRLVINCRSNPEHRCCVTYNDTDEESTTVAATTTTTLLVTTSKTTREPSISSPTTIDSVAELTSSTEPGTITEETVVPTDKLPPLDDPNINNLSENKSQKSVKDEPLIVATVEKVPVSVASTHYQVTTSQTEPVNKIDNPVQVISSSADELVEEERRRPPYQRIAAECFTMVFNCQQSPQHMCCPYQQHM